MDCNDVPLCVREALTINVKEDGESKENKKNINLSELFIKHGMHVKPKKLGDGLLTLNSVDLNRVPIAYGQDRVGRWFFCLTFKKQVPTPMEVPEYILGHH